MLTLSILVRPMIAADAPFVAALSQQLGYPIAPDVIAERLARLELSPDHKFLAAVQEGIVLGWVHVYGVHLLESPAPFAEIGGLVVDVNDPTRQASGL